MPKNIPSTIEMENRHKGEGHSEVDGAKLDAIKKEVKVLRRNRMCQVFIFLVIFALDVADLLSDWFLYVDVSLAKPGLVYGPPDQRLVNALLAFSIIGSITFILEAVNMGKEIFTYKPYVDVDFVSALIIWIEDVPQIVINVLIALCREDPISVFQTIKAAVILISIVIRIITSIIRYTNKKSLAQAKMHTAYTNRHIFYHVMIILGLLVNAACAIAVFIFTETTKDANGNINFEIPDSIFEAKYHDERYFKNVSIYFHHQAFDLIKHNENDTEYKWMRLMKVNTIRNQKDKRAIFNFQYEDLSNTFKMVLWEKVDNGDWNPVECYSVDKTTFVITNETNCETFLTGDTTSFLFLFYFVSPDTFFHQLVFGDIKFNLKVNNSITCIENNKIAVSIKEGYEKQIPIIHYYRTLLSEDYHLLNDNGKVRFYENVKDFEDITKVWETGWSKCDTTGVLAPHYDTELEAPCYMTKT